MLERYRIALAIYACSGVHSFAIAVVICLLLALIVAVVMPIHWLAVYMSSPFYCQGRSLLWPYHWKGTKAKISLAAHCACCCV